MQLYQIIMYPPFHRGPKPPTKFASLESWTVMERDDYLV